MAAWIWSSMAGAVPARAPPPSISPSPIGASSKEARLGRRKSPRARNPLEPRGPAPMQYLLSRLGGGGGSRARSGAGSIVPSRFGARFPVGTMVVNVTGCFLVGLTMTLLTERLQPHPYWRLVLGG